MKNGLLILALLALVSGCNHEPKTSVDTKDISINTKVDPSEITGAKMGFKPHKQ